MTLWSTSYIDPSLILKVLSVLSCTQCWEITWSIQVWVDHGRIQNCVSDRVVCSTGAQWGKVLAPFIFTIYTTDFYNAALQYSTVHCLMQKLALSLTGLQGLQRTDQGLFNKQKKVLNSPYPEETSAPRNKDLCLHYFDLSIISVLRMCYITVLWWCPYLKQIQTGKLHRCLSIIL